MGDDLQIPNAASVSTPPQAKVIGALHALVMGVMASLCELAIIIATTHEHAHGRLSTEVWVGAVLVPALGPLIGKARGKVPGPTVLALGGALAQIAQRTGKLAALLGLATVLQLSLQGCAGQQLPPDAVPRARALVHDMAKPIAAATPRLNRVGDAIAALCRPPEPALPPQTCADLAADFDAGTGWIDGVQSAIVQLDAALAVIEALERLRQ